MKVFLGILLYLVCSECRIEDGPVEQIPYTVLGTGQADDVFKNYNPVIIKDLNDYTQFYLNYYGKYPGYTDFDFTKNMMAVFFISSNSEIKIDDIYETNDQISIHMYRPPAPTGPYLCGSYPMNYDPQIYFMAISLKRSNKVVRVYN